MQLGVGIKKELMELFCTKRWLAFLIPALYCVLIDPLMALVTPKLLEVMGMGELALQFPSGQAYGMQMFAADFCSTGVLVFLLAMMKTAGGDQKGKTCVIPICNGFGRTVYISAKFIVYPAFLLLWSIVCYLAAYGYTALLFEERLPFAEVLLPMFGMALFTAFCGTMMLALGCMTGKGGISAAVVIGLVMLVPSILSMLQINRYNPMALMAFASGVGKEQTAEFFISAATAVGGGALLWLLTTAVFRRKKLV